MMNMIKASGFKQIAEGELSKSIEEARSQLEEQQALFASIVDSSDDIILSKTLDGIITSWNHGAEKVLGYTAKEIIGKHVSILIPDYLQNEEDKMIEKVSKGKVVAHYETERVRKDGKIILVSLTLSPIRDFTGKIIGASKIARDITKQKKMEEEIINANKEKETILNRISDGVVSLDNEWRYTFLNDAAMATHPLSKKETLGKVIWDVHPEMGGTIFWDKYHEAMLTRKPVEVESHYEAMNIWFSVKVYPSADGLTIFYKDISESKKAGQDLIKTSIANKELLYQNKEKEKRASELVIANKELVFQSEEKEKRAAELIIANKELVFQSAEKEKRATELVIANAELVFQNEEKEKRAAELIIANEELIFQSGEKEKRAAELIIANKELVYQNEEKEKRASELIIANKELLFQSEEKEKRAAELIIANKELGFQNQEKEKRAAELIVANQELAFESTEKEKRAAELIVANKELVFQNAEKENRTIELIKAEEQLKEVNGELESFSYSVSHDLRTPLRAINGYAKMLEEDYKKLFDDEGRRLLSVVQENAKKMGVLIDDLLAFSRLGRKEIHKSKINMNALAESAFDDLAKSSPGKAKIKINDLEPAMADYTLMNQVWMNLLSNAIKYSSNTPNPYIEISSEKKGNEVIYCVTDNGAGFDMQYAHKLFGVFQRLHDSEEFEGTGVGLALVQRIITKHDGKIWAKGAVGKGATFYFSLPGLPDNE